LSRRQIEFPIEGLSDGEIALRPMSEADVDELVTACRDPEIPRWTQVPDDYRESDAREWLETAGRRRQDGAELHLVIVDARDGRLLGSIGFGGIDWEDRRGSIGYWVAAHARRRGVATRAVRLLATWGFDELGFGRVEIKTEPGNAASQSVAQSAGFTREGLLRSHALIKGRRRDMVVFSLLPGDLSQPGGRR
jgi:[ribosomal protein S5]-alanine N-acetyltransferase